ATAMKSLIPLLYKLEEGADGNKKAVIDMAKAYDLFKLRGAQAAAILVEAFASGDFEEVLEQTYRLGIAEKMAATQGEGLILTFQRMIGKAKLVATTLGEKGIVGILKKMVNGIETAMVAIESFLNTGFGSIIVQATALSLAINGLFKAFKLLGGIAVASGFISFLKMASLWLVSFRSALVGAGVGLAILGGSLLTFLTSAGGIITILALVVTGIYRLVTANKRAADEARVAAGEIDKEIVALDVLSSKLNNTKEDSYEYVQSLLRFQKENEETAKKIAKLTGVVDISTLSLKEYNKAAKAVKTENLNSEIEKLTVSYEKYNKQVDIDIFNARRKELGWLGSGWAEAEAMSVEELAEKYKDVKDSVEDVESAETTLIRKLVELNSESKLTIQDLRDMDLTGKNLQTVWDKLTGAVERHEEAQKRIQGELEATIKKMTKSASKEYNELYKNLSATEKVRLLEVEKNIEKEKAAYRKRAESIGISEAAISAVLKAIEVDRRAEFTASMFKETDSREEAAKRKLDILRKSKEDAVKIAREEVRAIKIEMITFKRIHADALDFDEQLKDYENQYKQAKDHVEEIEKAFQEKMKQYNFSAAKDMGDSIKDMTRDVEKTLESSARRQRQIKTKLLRLDEQIADSEIERSRRKEDNEERLAELRTAAWKAKTQFQGSDEAYWKQLHAANKALQKHEKQMRRDEEDRIRAIEKEQREKDELLKKQEEEKEKYEEAKSKLKELNSISEKFNKIISNIRADIDVSQAMGAMDRLIRKLDEAIRKKNELSSNSSGGYIPGFQTGGFIQKRLGGIINWLAGGGKLGGYGGGDRVPAMLEAGEYVIR
ncbi:MAG: hypothetical protein U9Q21_02870, partial [Candidatus Auribacterota bacterium]|nr:hypothetical protein [Candidatus Auribacterota bacterium]